MEPKTDFVDLTDQRAFFRLSGGDRVRYLNGQVTNDVRKATAEAAIYALVTTAKGKIEGDVFVSPIPDDDALLIDAPMDLQEALFTRLDRYIIADDAELEDVTGQLGIVHQPGVTDASWEPENAKWQREANRFGPAGRDILTAGPPHLPENLVSKGMSPEQLEELRISHGFARWGAELGPNVLPQEANLQDRAIDFHKGCYIGQEVISRIKSVGRVNRYLVALVANEPGSLEAGWELFHEDVAVGTITSLAFSQQFDRIIALGFVKRGHEAAGTSLVAKSPENNLSSWLEIRETPFS